MLKTYRDLRNKNDFLPGPTGIFLNQAYLMRRTLAEAIRYEAKGVRGAILDFGCGARPYETLFDVDEYVGLDIEKSGHPPDGKRADIYYDGKRVPLENSSIDHVFSAEVFEHVFNAPELFREIYRVIKPRGTLILTCPFVWPLHEEPYDFARYTPYALQSLLIEAGFEKVTMKSCGHPIEAIFQLTLSYVTGHFIPRIPILGGALRIFFCGTINLSARVLSRFLPSDGKLYLSNVVVATKASK